MTTKTILITGSTDGIGLEAAKALSAQGHRVLLHGRNPDKLARAAAEVGSDPATYVADLSSLKAVETMAERIAADHPRIDVLINNAGVFLTRVTETDEGLDLRFVVNTIAPYLLMRRLLPCLDASGRVVNLSSAAQAPVHLAGIAAPSGLDDRVIYAQSKLALTMWSHAVAAEFGADGPSVYAVNPGSLLATKMVNEAFGIPGKDVGIGCRILVDAALSERFDGHSGEYFDNDSGDFGPPHPDALDMAKCQAVVQAIEAVLGR